MANKWQKHNKKQSIEKEINQKQFLPKNLKHRFSCTGSYENSFLKTDQYTGGSEGRAVKKSKCHFFPAK